MCPEMVGRKTGSKDKSGSPRKSMAYGCDRKQEAVDDL